MGIGKTFAYTKSAWQAERSQWALWLPVCLGFGIAVYFALPVEPPPMAGIFAVALCIWVYFFSKPDFVRISAVALMVCALGFTSAQWRTQVVRGPVIDKRTPPVRLSGSIEQIEFSDTSGRLILSALSFGANWRLAVPNKIRISFKEEAARFGALLPGDRVTLTAVLRPPPPPTMPGAFDFQRHAWFMGIGAFGFVLGGIETVPAPSGSPPTRLRQLLRHVEAVRLGISARVHRLAPGESGAVAAALLTGHRAYIDEEVLRIMRDAGIAHLLAISGLHIGLVAGIVFAGIRLLCATVPYIALRLNTKKCAAALSIPAAFAYAVLAGFTVPTERAFIMTGLMLGGVLIDRRALSMRSVCWAAGLVLLFRPESLTGPGFQMSFAAVTALIAVYAVLNRRKRAVADVKASSPAGKAGKYVLGVVLTTVVASAATAPFAVYHFQHASAFGLVANAVAVPLAALWVMPAGIITLWAMPFGLEDWPLRIMCTGIDLILDSAAYLSSLPGAAIDIAAPPLWCLCVVTLAGLWLSLWQGRWRLLALPFLAFGLCGPAFTLRPDIIIDGEARLVAILNSDHVYLTSSNRAARFEKESWQKRAGQAERPMAWRRTADSPQGRVRCDADGCTLSMNGRMIAISLAETTLADDCRRSWMLIATVPVRGGCDPPWGVIDRFDLWRDGTHAIAFTEKGPVITSVNAARGLRPWVIRPREAGERAQ